MIHKSLSLNRQNCLDRFLIEAIPSTNKTEKILENATIKRQKYWKLGYMFYLQSFKTKDLDA